MVKEKDFVVDMRESTSKCIWKGPGCTRLWGGARRKRRGERADRPREELRATRTKRACG